MRFFSVVVLPIIAIAILIIILLLINTLTHAEMFQQLPNHGIISATKQGAKNILYVIGTLSIIEFILVITIAIRMLVGFYKKNEQK